MCTFNILSRNNNIMPNLHTTVEQLTILLFYVELAKFIVHSA